MSSKLFSFSRPLPEPFNKVKKRSKYPPSTEMVRSPLSVPRWRRPSSPISSAGTAPALAR